MHAIELSGIRNLQAAHKEWVERNFPEQVSHHGLLGMCEEVGELAHAHLKKEQGIRGTDEEHDAAIRDALGDVFIYAMSYCNTNELDLAGCIEEAWNEVAARDWQANKQDGVTA